MANNEKTITESAYDVTKGYNDEIYGNGKISKETMTLRRTTVYRALEAANAALSVAQAAGNTKEVAALQDKIDELNALLNSVAATETEQSGAAKDDANGETPKEDEKRNADADSSEDADKDQGDEAENGAKENNAKKDSSDPQNEKDNDKIVDPGWQDDSAGENKSSDDQHADDGKSDNRNGGSSSDSSDDRGNDQADKEKGEGGQSKDDKPNQNVDKEKGDDEGEDAESKASPDDATDKQAGDSDSGSSDETEDEDGKKTKTKGKNRESSDSEDSEDNSEDSEGDSEDSEDDQEDESGSNGDKSKAAESGDDEADSDEEEDDEGDDDSEDDDDPDSAPGKPKIKDGKVLVNPFSHQVGQQLPRDIAGKINLGMLQTEAEWDAVIRILSKLKGDAKRGAKDALLDILKEKGIDVSKYTKGGSDGGTTGANESLDRKLTEALKALEDMSDDEFNDMINKVFDEIDKVKKPKYSTDIEARIQEIKDDASNSVMNRELGMEDNINTRADNVMHAKARAHEQDKYGSMSTAGLKGLSSFKQSLYRAIKNQVESIEDEDASWSAIDRRHEDDKSVVKKGIIIDDMPNKIPSIDVYFDQSPSWTEHDIELGIQAISVLNEFDKRKEIKLNIYYFALSVFSDAASARAQSGTLAWSKILENLAAHKAKNAIIMTDGDMDGLALDGRSLWLDGCVWYLWGRTRSPHMLEKLRGRKGTLQYMLKG